MACVSTTAKKTEESDTESSEAKLWEACETQPVSANNNWYKYLSLILVSRKYINNGFEVFHRKPSARCAPALSLTRRARNFAEEFGRGFSE